MRRFGLGLAAAILLAAAAVARQNTALVAAKGQFLLDGKPFQIISGEMHYARVPREYWRDRFRKARAMGLNTISTYVFWNFHEASPGQYEFTGQKDVAEYIREAGQEGLHVILRPGPYVCAEWEFGGYPGWLFAAPGIVVRSTDEKFTTPAARWLDRLGRELTPLLSSHGGPIIAVQVENEYGSFDKDTLYMEWQRDALKHAGFTNVMLYTADGGVQLPNGTLPDLPAVVNFGGGGATGEFAKLQAFRPDGPMMSGEYWAGWFDQWGLAHHTTNAAQQTRELAWMLDHGYSVNLYMFHGGTTPGFMNGANIDRGRYLPQTSSYDYDSALDESGRPTPKYDMFRDVIAKHTASPLPPIPVTPAPIVIPPFTLTDQSPLFGMNDNGSYAEAEYPRSMESFGQSIGYILYNRRIDGPVSGDLVISEVRDYAQVYLDGTLIGTADRRLGQTSLTLPVDIRTSSGRLAILVENTGRVNFAKPLRDERKGITGTVTLAGKPLVGSVPSAVGTWAVRTMPMLDMPKPAWEHRQTPIATAAYYRETFNVPTPGDTFLDTRGWGKGTVWINGHHLGRFWDIGPQQTLYVPGPWLRKGANEIVVFDLMTPTQRTMSGLAAPILNELKK